ncbi:hypothetical protein LOZ33_006299, partial [Ophidiomyces ophidiicola]
RARRRAEQRGAVGARAHRGGYHGPSGADTGGGGVVAAVSARELGFAFEGECECECEWFV